MINKRILIIAFIGILVLTLPIVIYLINQNQDTRSGATASQVAFSLFERTKNVQPGSEFEVEVKITPNGVTVNAFEFALQYPTSQLEYVSFTRGSGLAQSEIKTNGQQGTYSIFSFEGYPTTTANIITTERTLGKIKFKVKSGVTNGTIIPVTFQKAVAVNSTSGTTTSYQVDTSASGNYTVGSSNSGGGNSNPVNFFFQPGNTTVSPGQTATVILKTSTNSKPLSSFDVKINYPTNLLQITDADIQGREGLTTEIITVENGQIQIIGGMSPAINGSDQTLATLKFTVLTSAQNSTVTLSPVVSIDPSATTSITNGTITIQSQSACNGTTGRPNDCACQQSSQCASNFCNSSNKCTTPQATFTPIPTDQPANTQLKFSVSLPGIGKAHADDNKTPIRSSRQATVSVYNQANQLVTTDTTTAQYNTTTGNYDGAAALPDTIPNGNYLVKVKLENTLVKQVPGTVTITSNSQNNQAPNVPLTNGDLVQDNELTIADYTKFVACYKKLQTCSAADRAKIDLDDDGVIESTIFDIGILQRGFANRSGD